MRSMKELKDVPSNGLKVASTFSGAGGSCLGYRMAGYEVIWANEFNEEARKTYQANHSSHIDPRDIREIGGFNLPDEKIDLLDGSPPCSAFSTSGSRERGWGKIKAYSDTHQRVDDLFFEYIRIRDLLKPRAFIAENVTGLAKGKAKGYFNEIMAKLKEGYRTRALILSANSYGVPQSRERLFFIGYRNDLDLTPKIPEENSKMSIMRDFTELDDIKMYLASGYPNRWLSAEKRSYPTLTASIGSLSRTAYMSANGFIKDAAGKERKLTVKEAKIIQSFPLDFKLSGDYKQQMERLGRSVPPIMMCSIAKSIERQLNGNTK